MIVTWLKSNFAGSDRRPQLFAKLEAFLAEARAAGLVRFIFVDGSFVPAKPDPNDIDLILVVPATHDFAADLPPRQYGVLAQQRVRRRFGFDIVVAKNDSGNLDEAVTFFTQVRQRPGVKKRLLRLNV